MAERFIRVFMQENTSNRKEFKTHKMVCCVQYGQRQETMYHYPNCELTLYVDKCSEAYHTTNKRKCEFHTSSILFAYTEKCTIWQEIIISMFMKTKLKSSKLSTTN
jgi:hypothetical protein